MSTGSCGEVIRAREEQRRLRRIPAVVDREKTILASPCSIKSLEGPACHSFLPSPPRSISTPLYLFVLHITASDLAGVHHGVVNRDHPRVFGVVQEDRLVLLIILEKLRIKGSSEEIKFFRSL
jgi:hypothetical protein